MHCIRRLDSKKKLSQKIRSMLLSLTLIAISANAQNTDESFGVLIVGRPAETIIQLKGAYVFTGRTPFSIPQNLSGPYVLSASKTGFESKSMKLFLGYEPFRQIDINLKPISRWKAGLRSLLIPGWGQRYKGAKGRGLLFTGLAIGASVGTLVTQLDYSSDLDDANRAKQDYQRVSNNFEQASAAYDKWQAAYRRADDSYDRRQRSLAITAAVWALNFLDALFLPPGPGDARREKTPLTNHIGFNDSKIELKFSF